MGVDSLIHFASVERDDYNRSYQISKQPLNRIS